MSSIAIKGVKKAYARNAVVHGVDLEIATGEFIVILGPSGCGKSTLLRMIAGLEEISGGEIWIDGKLVNKMEPRERGCAMVFQNYALYPHMTVAENIGYALKVAGVPKAERAKRVAATAKVVGLEAFLDRRPAALSGGQRQRVAMGRAIVREPKVFLFDEPLSNLDAKLRVAMRAEIRRLHRRLGATSVFVTHDQTEAMTMGDRLVVMNGGRIEQVGTPAEVYNRPATRFVANFVGSPSMNLMEGAIDRHGVFVYDEQRRIPLPGAIDARLVGHKVTLGVRAEAARLVAPGTPGSLPATVDFIEELGAGRVVHTDFDGLSFAVALSGPASFETGDAVGVEIDPADIHLFAADTGKRIDALTSQPLAAASL
ncbi:sn-glycerol-3-phosphate ABC transporter ATP-binding protein UgpC [Kaistia defluvii]|uniref:Sn-glycerol 3-phosphate transport system ATP-binding protein n=1 Tax=Kaistia defluvii TaxID=410841 RepID=A0ABV2QUE3_9HYPH